MPVDTAPELRFGVAKEELTSLAGLALAASLVKYLGLAEALARRVRIKQRRRGCRDEQMLLALIYSQCAGGGHLSEVDSLQADAAACRASGLRAVPDSRRLGEYLGRMTDGALAGLAECARIVSRRLVPQLARHCRQSQGYVPVFVDGTGVEVQGQQFEGAALGYNGQRQYWLHSVFVGGAWVSGRLERGGTDVKGAWREQLERDVAPLLGEAAGVWLRADSAYYCHELVAYCRQRGWDYSLSVTDPRQKAPLLRIVEAVQLAEAEWVALDEDGHERATLVYYRPGQWASEEAYVVVRQDRDGDQPRLLPAWTVILVSRDDLSLPELVRRHRGKQGQENALKGPLSELGLHHPPCRSYQANQAFYLCGQIAQLLLRSLQYQMLPEAAREHGLRPLIRHLVRSVGRLVRSGRRQRLLFGRGNYRLDWLVYAAGRLEPG